jgi:hypothetical protein
VSFFLYVRGVVVFCADGDEQSKPRTLVLMLPGEKTRLHPLLLRTMTLSTDGERERSPLRATALMPDGEKPS